MAKRKKATKRRGTTRKAKQRIKVFISHSSKDRALALRLVRAIETGVEIRSSEIRCSSVTGYKLPTGRSISRNLRKEIGRADAVIGLVTRNSVSSPYVLFELGAAWGLKIPTFPLLAKGTTARQLPGPLRESHACRLAKRSDAAQAIDDLCRRTKLQRKKDNLALFTSAIDRVAKLAKR